MSCIILSFSLVPRQGCARNDFLILIFLVLVATCMSLGQTQILCCLHRVLLKLPTVTSLGEADCVPREAILHQSLGIYEWVEDTKKWQSTESCMKRLSWWEPCPLSLAQLLLSLAVFSLLTVDREIIKCCSILHRWLFQQISVLALVFVSLG